MNAVLIIAGIAVGLGVPAGAWLSMQPKQAAKSHGGAAAGLGFVCAACGHGHSLEQIRRSMYLGQRTIGDYQALTRGGPLRLGKRIIRRKITRTLMRSLWH